jgi:hypothetical protein
MENLFGIGEYTGMSYDDVVIDIVDNYQIEKSIVDTYKIVVAMCEYGDYDGSSYFLLIHRSTGKLYEVFGGHCSCYGFEGQFEPEETTVEYIFSEHYKYRNVTNVMTYLSECLCYFFGNK